MSAARRARYSARRPLLALTLLAAGFAALSARAVHLQLFQDEMLRSEGSARYLRTVVIKPNRGRIMDRNGSVLAVSTPVDSLWAHPATLLDARPTWGTLAAMLGTTDDALEALCRRNAGREFMYLRRHLAPDQASAFMELGIAGLALQREYRRYYPAGPVAGHVIGFTNIDDRGQEGIERVFDDHLAGLEGVKRVIRDLRGHVIENVDSIRPVHHGEDLVLSIDSRLQFLAHRQLAEAVRANDAGGGTVVLLDVASGEVLAMVNEPDFNPNSRDAMASDESRNRAVTDVLEPGSTIKPFTVLTALASGRFEPGDTVETSPGHYRIGGRTIRDIHDYGTLTVARVLVKSSNIGAARIALQLAPDALYDTLEAVGFGTATGIELPGERSGVLVRRQPWRDIELATLSYGYGLSATPLQLARAYATLANGGRMVPVTLLRRERPPGAERVLPAAAAATVSRILVDVVGPEGTAGRARVPGYRVAGKTGTVHKLGDNGYLEDRYQSLFAGFAPASAPRFAMVVVIDDPRGKAHYGGAIAAPVFAAVMEAALRLYSITPDDPQVIEASHRGIGAGGDA